MLRSISPTRGRLRSTYSPLLLILPLIVSAFGAAQAQHFDRSELSDTCKPCNDFYQYANEGWLRSHPIPDDHSEWSHWNGIEDRNLDILHEVLDHAAAAVRDSRTKPGTAEQQIGAYYLSAMDTSELNRDGIAPIESWLTPIERMKNLTDLRKVVAELHPIGCGVLFGFGSDIDAKNSSRIVATCWQGGLGLPEREYYLKTDSTSRALRAAYVEHIARTFALAGIDTLQVMHDARIILDIETSLARASMTLPEQRDPDSTYHDLTVAELGRLTPHFSWPEYLRELGYPGITEVIVGQPKFLKSMDSLLASRPIEQWRAYFAWHLLSAASDKLGTQLNDEQFHFAQLLYGAKTQLPLWKRRVRSTDRALGEALGQEYVKIAFPPESKARMLVLIKNLSEALRADLTNLDWIGESTRAKALEKLNAFTAKIGYPDHWRDYSKLEIGDVPFVINAFHATKFEFNRNMLKIGKPVDRTEWGMTPPTVNAYYNSSLNEIVFPAGILQPPFFDPSSDDAYNYGAIGAIIGHEMTHGFDDEGAKSDAKGNLRNWWAPEDLKQFEARSQCVLRQFDGYTIQDSIHLKGDQVVGESIADLGGVTLAFRAYERSIEGKPRQVIDGFTPEQRFFIGWARVWASNMRPELERTLAFTDFHAISRYRVIGPLSNFPPFAAAFGCVAGEKMVRKAADQCVIW